MLALQDPTMQMAIGAAIVALLVVLALVLRARAAKARRGRHRAPDVLDAGAAPAVRNRALIDAPSAAARLREAEAAAGLADTGPGIMGGIGSVIAAAAAAEAGAAHHGEGEADDLTRMKGVGPKLRARLAELGVTRFAQIAAWSDADLAAVDAQLGAFAGRAVRDGWVEQAGYLAVGDVAGFEARFGKL